MIYENQPQSGARIRDGIRRLCGERELPEVLVYEEIDSTNSQAKRLAMEGVKGPVLLVAESQTAGRGRMGRQFYSPAGSGVYLSILYSTRRPLQDAVTVTGAASVAVLRAIRALTGKQPVIKWVNDLYLDGRKVCGILTEALTDPYGDGTHSVIVGIGVNWYAAEFPRELCGIAGAVGAENVDRASLVATLWRELNPWLEDPDDRSWLEDYRRYSAVLGKEITWTQQGIGHRGTALEIDADGALLVRGEDGKIRTLSTGEITVRISE
ncbi:MAG: biotin--[Clostridia bacterium]|nr:biotin--[acetyl-CoA-carboxylase] ligase [Clostridia bacterium]